MGQTHHPQHDSSTQLPLRPRGRASALLKSAFVATLKKNLFEAPVIHVFSTSTSICAGNDRYLNTSLLLFAARARNQASFMEESQIRKTILAMALMFLIAGTVLAAFSIQRSHTEENILDTWDLNGSSALDPQAPGPSWARQMPEGSFFELNISASNTLRLRIGTLVHNETTGEDFLTNLVFDQVGTRFVQEVAVGGNDTYQVEIKNEGASIVSIWGNVLAKNAVVSYQTVYPYASLGTLALLTGSATMIYGLFTKPKKRPGKRL
jgi:hypothetical protein